MPFNQFYIPEIQQTIDIRADYFNWIQNQVIRTTIPARSYFERALVLLDDNVRKEIIDWLIDWLNKNNKAEEQ